MPDFSEVSPGKQDGPPRYKSASWLTAVSQAAAAYHGQAALGSSKGSKPSHSIDRSSVTISNQTGSDLVRGNYVQLGDFELDARDPRKMWFEGDLYDETSEQRIAIVTNAVKDGSRVKSVLIGIAVAVVDVTDIDHRFAEPVDGEYVLTSAASGDIEIIDTVTSTGEQECAVLLAASAGPSSSIACGMAIITTEVSGKTQAGDSITFGVGEAEPIVQTTLGEADGSSGELNPAADTGYKQKIYNMCAAPIPVGKIVQWKQFGTTYSTLGNEAMKFVDAEDCG